ncbi:hypothetical protein [Pseudodesulfovibrio portus]|uniref:Uncharacterized protein n=1 Tax=Pseudodesulfovibrio portus TaxID=231439 RepID=A0ABM8ANC1_9BACT|nr:hypothetical protein [Pseudodesulfovibrio portus]BDQ32874.1 hypothetical protein JCM14722_04160 [Pseudodesulfovibrio portus]
MRIRGSGKDTSGFGGSGSRSDSFRRKHHLKKKVRGVLLKNVEDNMAWVEIDGDRLLAQLEVIHPEGTRLTFVIEQLSPNIVLKELKGGGRQGGGGVLDRANAFDSARALFEARFISFIQDPDTPRPCITSGDFFTILAGSRELLARYADAVRCADGLTESLDDGRGRFLYQPWLAPGSRRQVTFVRKTPEGLTEAVVEFDHPSMGLVRAEFLHKNDRVACKLKMQHMAHAEPLTRYLASRVHPNLAAQADPPHITKLPQRCHGGVIAEHLFR